MDMYHLRQIPSEAQIQRFLRRLLFGKNVFCPRCSCRGVTARQDRYWCPRCRRRFSLLSHTWLSCSKLSYQRLWLLLWCYTQAVPIKQSRRLGEVSESAMRHWYDLFRANLPENHVILEKIVQMDEAYFKRQSLIMAKQKGSRHVAYQLLQQSSVQRQQATVFLQQHIKPRSRLHTDGAGIYQGIERWWPVRHRTDIHRKWEFERTSEIEGLFGNLRTFIRRMYHHVTPEKLPEYVREFCVRFSSPETFESPRTFLQKTLTRAPFD